MEQFLQSKTGIVKNFLICFIIRHCNLYQYYRDADIRLSAGLVGSGLLQSGHSVVVIFEDDEYVIDLTNGPQNCGGVSLLFDDFQQALIMNCFLVAQEQLFVLNQVRWMISRHHRHHCR